MLSIIITHYKTPILLKLCIKSIYENIGNLNYEIIIADSESRIEDQEMIKEHFPKVKFAAFTKNVGYAKIVNAGIKKAQGDYLLILNADIIIQKGSLPKLMDFLKSNPEVGLVGPKLLTFGNQPQNSCFAFPSIGAILARRTFLGRLKWGKKKLDQFLLKNRDLSKATPVDWIQGSAMLVKKSAIKKTGLLDERFFLYLEDADWCRRFWLNGFKIVYLPDAKMSHYYYRISKKWGGALDLVLNKHTRIHIISAIKYFWKYRHNNT